MSEGEEGENDAERAISAALETDDIVGEQKKSNTTSVERQWFGYSKGDNK